MAKGTSSAKAEDAVRRYLTFLKSPQDLVDEKAIARAQAQVDRTAGGDVIEHIQALAALERAHVVDEAPLRDAFVAALPGWVEKTSVSVEVLRSFGAPDDVLVEAGLMSREKAKRLRANARRGTRRTTTTPAAPAAAAPRARARRAPAASTNGHGRTIVDYDGILAGLPPKGETFLATDVATATGKGIAQARNYVAAMRSKGLIAHVGEVDPWTGKGTAPYLYERV
jgi:hypothetical protein